MSTDVVVEVRRLPHAEGLALPAYQTEHAAGLDLVAAVGEQAALTLAPGERALVPTGLAIALPPGFEGQVRPRSGLALKPGITVLNAPGTIDADYRGELQVTMYVFGSAGEFTISHGDRIAQLVIASVRRAELSVTVALSETSRGAGGYGSTGR